MDITIISMLPQFNFRPLIRNFCAVFYESRRRRTADDPYGFYLQREKPVVIMGDIWRTRKNHKTCEARQMKVTAGIWRHQTGTRVDRFYFH